jgi:hypothetical protein
MPGLKPRAVRTARRAQLLEVSDLTGGVDLRRSPTLLGENRARTLLNYSLEEPGALTVRPGYQAASAASFGSNPQGGARVYLAASVFTLFANDGAVYKPSDAWAKGAAVHSTISTANQVFFPYDRDYVMVMDATARPRYSTNGTTWFLTGIDKPSTGPALSSASVSTATLSTGEYAVAITHKNRATAYESNASAESTITLAASTANAISGTFPASTDAKVDAGVVYARHKLPDGESVLRKVSSGAVGSSWTITSSNWTSNDEAPTNHAVPPALAFAVVWKNRWWAKDAAVGNRLRFTELFLPQAWPATFYIDIPFEKGDSIAAVQPLGDTLLVHGQSGVYLVIGQTSLDFEVRPAQGADAGAFGQRAVSRVEQAALHVSADGIDSFDGAADNALEFDIQPAWRDLVVNSGASDLAKIATVYDGLRKEFRIAVPRVYPTGARGEWVLNLDRTRENEGTPAWTTTDRDIAFYIHWNGNEVTAGDRGRLFTINSTGGIVFEESAGEGANSSNLTAEYEGPALSLGVNRARFTALHVEHEPHGGAFSVEVVTDGRSQGALALNIGAGLEPYGSTVTYGTPTRLYGGTGRVKKFTPLPIGSEGQTAVLRTVYIGRERFKHFAYTYQILPEGAPRQL